MRSMVEGAQRPPQPQLVRKPPPASLKPVHALAAEAWPRHAIDPASTFSSSHGRTKGLTQTCVGISY